MTELQRIFRRAERLDRRNSHMALWRSRAAWLEKRQDLRDVAEFNRMREDLRGEQ